MTAAQPPRTPTGVPGVGGPPGGPPTRRTGRAMGRGLFAALLVFVTVVLVLFVVFNTQTVDISMVFGSVEAPLVLALLVAAVLGGLVVGLAGLAVRARRIRRD